MRPFNHKRSRFVRQFDMKSGPRNKSIWWDRVPVHAPETISVALRFVKRVNKSHLFHLDPRWEQMAPKIKVCRPWDIKEKLRRHFPSRNRSANPVIQFSRFRPATGSAVGFHWPSSGAQENIPQVPAKGG